MRIEGEWLECDDGATRPAVRAHVHRAGGLIVREWFLIDTGADRTVYHADLYQRLRLAGDLPLLPADPPRQRCCAVPRLGSSHPVAGTPSGSSICDTRHDSKGRQRRTAG
jgi:hypothetical protein